MLVGGYNWRMMMTDTVVTPPVPVTPELFPDRWRAVLARDRAEDGRFVYAVTSTGIFCRPSCPSRRPRADRVRFFESPADATRAGFRACERCRPNEAGDPWVSRIARACQLIACADADVPLARLARSAGSTPHHFLRVFTRIVGVTPRQFADARRFESVRRLLRTATDVTSAFVEAGYGSSSRFYERAAPRLGMPPVTYRRGGVGQTIRYTTTRTAVGWMLVASTDVGICGIALDDARARVVERLRTEYPHATLEPTTDMRDAVRFVLDHLEGRTPRGDLPLDVRATAFQWQVWNALRAIPRGETRTYSDVARAMGRPTASRAVARACATNPVAVVVPCHRVVPAAGGVGEYRWGAARKSALLAREREPDNRSRARSRT